jgi:general secretion pathway protein L
MKTLTVALASTGPDTAAELAFVLSADGQTPLAQGQAPLALLPKADAVQLVVPVAQLAFHAITIPKAPKGKLWAALVGTMEDRLLAPPEGLALALQPGAQAGSNGWVACFERPWALAWVDAFEQAGHNVNRLLPQITPQDSPILWALGDTGNVWLTRADAKGVVSAPLLSAKWLLADLPPEQTVQCTPELSGSVESALMHPLEIHSAGQLLLTSARTPWDLAQFDLRVGRSAPWRRRLGRSLQAFVREPTWRWTRWGLAGLVGVNLLGLNVLALQERNAMVQKKEQQTELFKKTFPKVTTVLDAPVQMRFELDRLRQSGSQASPTDLESLLATLGQAQTKEQPLPFTQLDYQDRRLTVSGFLLQNDAINTLKSRLEASGHTSQLSPSSLTVPSKGQP